MIERETQVLLKERDNPIEQSIFILGEVYSNSSDEFVRSKIEEVFTLFEKEMRLDEKKLKLKDLFLSKGE